MSDNRSFIYIVFILNLSVVCLAQVDNIKFNKLSIHDGLTNNTVNSIIKDDDGYLWFATDYGLNRYDSKRFRTYFHNYNENNSLASNKVRYLFIDSKNNLWAGCRKGLSLYEDETDSFINFLEGEYIRSICEDNSNNLWIASNGGIIKFNTISFEYKYYKTFIHKDLNPKPLLSIGIDSSGNIWAGSDGDGVFRLDPYTGKVKNYNLNIRHKENNRGIILSIYQDSKHRLWFGSKIGLFLYDFINDEFINFSKKNKSLPDKLIFSITEDSQKNLWLGSYKGLFRYNPSSQNVYQYKYSKYNLDCLSSDLIRSVFLYNNNTIWVGTRDKGANFGLFGENRFILYDSYFSANGTNLPSNSITAVTEDPDGNLWVGTIDAGISKYDRKHKIYLNYQYQPSNPNSISENNIISIYSDNQYRIWIGTYNSGLNVLDMKTNKFSHYVKNLSNPYSVNSNVIQAIYQDSFGKVWIGTDGDGLNRYIPSVNGFKSYKSENNLGPKIFCFREDSSKVLWVGTNNGLSSYNRQTDIFNEYKIPISLLRNNDGYKWIYCIEIISNDLLMLGTAAGLLQYKKTNKEYSKIGLNKHLIDKEIFGILKDQKNAYWISTERGLYYFRLDESTLRTFNNTFGIQGNEFSINAYSRGRNSRFYFGGTMGLNEFNPEKINVNLNNIKIQLNDLIVNDSIRFPGVNSVLKKTLKFTNEIILPPDNYMFGFTYSVLNFANINNVNIQYKLAGYDKAWIPSQIISNNINYRNVSPGSYKFIIRLTDIKNRIIDKREINVILKPAFYQTAWFYTAVFLVFLFSLYALFKFRLNQLLKVDRLRVKLASDLHDDIGATLSKISMQAEMVKQRIDAKNSEYNLTRISELCSYSIDTMRDIIWSIDSRNDSFEKMLNKMKDETYKLLQSKNIVVKFNVINLNLEKKVAPETRQNLYLILKEAVNNIYKHSNADKVEITVAQENSRLELKVYDNGNKIKMNEYNSGNGLKNMKMRSKMIGGDFNFSINGGFAIQVGNVKIK